MKIDDRANPQSSSALHKESFQKALAPARPKVPPRRAPLKPLAGAHSAQANGAHAASSGRVSVQIQDRVHSEAQLQQTLSAARTSSDRTCADRTAARTEGLAAVEHQVKSRIAELLARDDGRSPDAAKREPPAALKDERPRDPSAKPVNTGQTAAPAAVPDAAQGAAPVSSVMALVEKVEVFVRSNRPTLSLSLGGELSGQVEIEKVGPGKVALRWVGGARQDAGAPERIRRALADRGLTVTRLQLG